MITSEFTLGVEEEYQLVDPESGDLRSRADRVLREDWSHEMVAELQDTMVEVGTRVCASGDEVAAELRRLRAQAAAVASAEGTEVAAAGLHPFARWERHRLAEGERPRLIADRFGRTAWDDHMFGMHVHVALPDEVDTVAVMDAVRPHLPLLVALTASSPLFEGDDTGYASYRTVLWRRRPLSGMPPRFGDAGRYRRFVDLLLRSGAVPDLHTLYWSVRPSSRHPTLEFRCMDVCPRVGDAAAVASLVRALTVAAAEGVVDGAVGDGFNGGLDDVLLDTNEWRAARYGLDAELIDPTARAGTTPVRDAIRRLVERVAPFAERLGDGARLAGVETILERGSGADRIRRARERTSSLPELVRWLVEETRLATGIDRRTEQREERETGNGAALV